MAIGRSVSAAMVLALLLPWTAHGERYALLVGVREYNTDGLRPLGFTEDDVAELAQVLLACGYRSDNVRLLTQHAGATRARYLPLLSNIRNELALMLRDRDPGDSVLVAFAGHGLQFRGEDIKYFCPMDAQVDDKRSLLPLDEVFRDLGRSGAGFKLLLVDACRNDPLEKTTRSARPTAELESVSRPLSAPPPGGVAAFFSCSEGEVAHEDPALKHGVFFHYVIEGLKGAAAVGDARQVALSDLEGYVKRRVDDHTRGKFGRRQLPELFNQSRGLFPIVTLDEGSVVERRAEVSMGRGQYAIAAEEYSEALRARASAPAYAGRSLCRYFLGDLDRAVADADSALRVDPRLALGYIARGMALDAQNRLAPALEDIVEAARLAPESPAGWGFAGVLYKKSGMRAKAIEAADRAIALPARNALDYLGRGDALGVRGDHAGAIRAADEVLRLGPNPLGYNIRAVASMELGRPDRALSDLDEIIKISPRCVFSWANRGFLHLRTGDLDRAAADFDAALARSPDCHFAHLGLGQVHMARRATDLALAAFDKAVAIQPALAECRLYRANARLARGDRDGALADADEAIRLDPSIADVYLQRAAVRVARGEFDRALPDLDRGIGIAQTALLFQYRALVQNRLRRFDAALADADEAIRRDPKNAAAYCERAYARTARGEPDLATADAEAAIRLAPNNPDGYMNRGWAYRARNDPRADADFREAERLRAPAPR